MAPSTAIAGAFIIVTVLVAAFLYVPNFILTGLSEPGRATRVWMATGWVALAFVGCAWLTWRRTTRHAEPPEDGDR